MSTAATLGLFINIIGILVSILVAWTVLSQSQQLGGRFGSAISFFLWGVLFQALAFAYTIGVDNLGLKEVLTLGGVNYHHALMAVGMILFALSAKRFMSLGK